MEKTLNRWIDRFKTGSLYPKLRGNRFIGRLFVRETFFQFLRYLIVGFSCFTVEYVLFVILRAALPLSELMVNTCVYTVIFWGNFLANRWFSFRSTAPILRQMLSYGILFFINLVVGNILLFSAIRALLVMAAGEGSWPVLYLPKIIIMVFIVSWNFILYKKVIYK